MDIEWKHLKRVLADYGQYFIDLARTYLGENHSYASGTLGDTMDYQVLINDERMAVGIELEDYWVYVEKGRKPGKFPPIEDIMEWITVKPVTPRPYSYTPSVKSLSFLIQRSIKESKGYAPPSEALQEWIEKKGIKPERVTITPSVRQLAFLIGRKIAEKGTDPKPFFERAKREAYDHFQEPIYNAILEDVEDYLNRVIAESSPFK